MIIYMQLFWHIKPATIIEIGAYSITIVIAWEWPTPLHSNIRPQFSEEEVDV